MATMMVGVMLLFGLGLIAVAPAASAGETCLDGVRRDPGDAVYEIAINNCWNGPESPCTVSITKPSVEPGTEVHVDTDGDPIVSYGVHPTVHKGGVHQECDV